jgi:hypothetical protein
MRRAVLLAGFLVLTNSAPGPADDQKEKTAQLILQQTTAGDLQGRKVQRVELIKEAGAPQEIRNILGDEGEPPIRPGKYFPQAVVIVLEGDLRIQTNAYLSAALPKGTALGRVKRRGLFTAEIGKDMLKLAAFDSVVQQEAK